VKRRIVIAVTAIVMIAGLGVAPAMSATSAAATPQAGIACVSLHGRPVCLVRLV